MIAIITARGGSKGLPGKNIKELNGKPLIAYTIEAALNSKYVTKVIVNTDDAEIAAVSEQYGAEIPFLRPIELASDKATSLDVLKHTVGWYRQHDISIEEFVLLQPTSPLRNHSHIDEAIELYKSKNADAIISFCQESHPVYWHKFIDDNGKISEVFNTVSMPRQSYRPTFLPNGAIYILKSILLEKGKFYTEKTYGYIMERKFSIDIDTLEDFEYAEFLLNKNEY